MIVGIDLGTTFSAIAKMDDSNKPQIIPNLDGGRTTPSVVMFDGGDVCVGEQAKLNSITDPLNVCQFVKRQMGEPNFRFENEHGDRYSSEDISAMILKSLAVAAEKTIGEKITGAVITVPAYFNDAQRKSTQDAGAIAGLNVMAVINEPTAAAIAFCNDCHNYQKQKVLVFDLGGGTFDVTIMEMDGVANVDILSTNGHKNLGGFDFDNQIIQMIVDEFDDRYGIELYDDDIAMQDLRIRAEAAKKTLSTRQKATIAIMSQNQVVKKDITREEFEASIQSILNNAQTIVELAVKEAGIAMQEIEKVILVGGSTRIPAVQQMIQRITGITPSHDVHPDEAVALGAACYARGLDPNRQSTTPVINVSDVNAHSLGIISNNTHGVAVNNHIIPRNTKIPTQMDRVVYAAKDNQSEMMLQITEGEDEDLNYVTIIGETLLIFPPVPLDTPIRVVMSYDINGLVHVSVYHGETGAGWGEMQINRKSNLSSDDIKEKINNMARIQID